MTETAEVRSSFSMKILIADIAASMVMGMWEMILEAVITGGDGFWSPLVYIAATVVRSLQDVAIPVGFDLVGVVLGLMGHMMNSIVLGVVFALWIAPRLPSMVGQVVTGMMYGAAVFVVMWYVLLPLIDPVMLNLNAIIFLAAHPMWGGALGLINRVVNTADQISR